MAAVEKVEKKHGGARPGSGMKKGQKTKKTLEREIELQRIKQRVFAAVDVIVDGQLSAARGITYLYKIEKDKIVGPKGGVSYKAKRPEIVTNQLEIESYLAGLIDEGEADDPNDPASTYYYMTTEKPETSAAHLLLDRAFGKVTQAISGPDGGPIEVKTIEVSFKKK